MRFVGKWPSRTIPTDMTKERQTALDFLRIRGTAKKPDAPRDVIAQAAPRGVLLTWNNPAVFFDVDGWRIYKGNESTLFTEIRDRGNRQCFVESTAATTSPVQNFFVSAINSIGVESSRVQVQKAALNESGAPATPGTPPGYSDYSSDKTATTGLISGSKQLNQT